MWKENIFSVGVCFQIFFASLFFGFGIWKLHEDFVNVFLRHEQKFDAWMEIIQSLELLISLFGVVATIAENISKRKFPEKKEAYTILIRQSIPPTRQNKLYFFLAFFYASFLVAKMFWHIMRKNETDTYSFLLKITGQCFLIGEKLRFSVMVFQIKNHFQALNINLAETMSNFGKSKIWISETVKGRNMFLSFRDHCNVHWEACKFIEIVNQTFGFRLTFIIIDEFYKLMFIPYLLAFNLLKTYRENKINIFINVFFLFYHATEVLVLVFQADSATSEANKTKIILCKHLQLKLSNENIEEMLGAVTTYMIIFIQLQETLNFNEISNWSNGEKLHTNSSK